MRNWAREIAFISKNAQWTVHFLQKSALCIVQFDFLCIFAANFNTTKISPSP